MKTISTITIILLFVLPLKAQQEDIKTHSVSIENFINFVAETYTYQEPDNQSIETNNITFLIQVANTDINTEDLIILKQGFKLLSERLNQFNSISILTYFGYNGTALKMSRPSDLPMIYNTLINLKSKIHEFKDDGVDHAYRFAKENYVENAKNSIVIIRNTNAAKVDVAKLSKKDIKKIKRKKKKGEILKVAASLVPEIIAILKN